MGNLTTKSTKNQPKLTKKFLNSWEISRPTSFVGTSYPFFNISFHFLNKYSKSLIIAGVLASQFLWASWSNDSSEWYNLCNFIAQNDRLHGTSDSIVCILSMSWYPQSNRVLTSFYGGKWYASFSRVVLEWFSPMVYSASLLHD